MLTSALTGDILETPIYISKSDKSITSLSQVIEGETIIYYDPKIGHLQTNALSDLYKYYDEEYKFFDQSDEDDILYTVKEGKKIFRQEHQLDTLLSKVEFKSGTKILDYGCAKGTVLKRLHARKSDIVPYLFDVSRMYEPLWKAFLNPDRYASYNPKEEWVGLFDVITSFFAFEHVQDPLKELESIKKLCKPEGIIYMIVPNVYENAGDFIVVDHIHHYSELSLTYMFAKAGFEIIEIDKTSHFGAFIIVGRKSKQQLVLNTNSKTLEDINKTSQTLAEYWSSLQSKIDSYEELAGNKKAAIYGAGVYGNFIAISLKNFNNIVSFIDQNPLLLGKPILNRPVVLPGDISEDIEVIYVGLNPSIATNAMAKLNLDEQKIKLFYL